MRQARPHSCGRPRRGSSLRAISGACRPNIYPLERTVESRARSTGTLMASMSGLKSPSHTGSGQPDSVRGCRAFMLERDMDRRETLRWLGQTLHNSQAQDLELALSCIHLLAQYAQTDRQHRVREELRKVILRAAEGDPQPITQAWQSFDEAWTD